MSTLTIILIVLGAALLVGITAVAVTLFLAQGIAHLILMFLGVVESKRKR